MAGSNGSFLKHHFMHNVADLDAMQPGSVGIPIPHSDWFISEAPRQITLLINQNDASIPTYFFLFPSNFRGLMRESRRK